MSLPILQKKLLNSSYFSLYAHNIGELDYEKIPDHFIGNRCKILAYQALCTKIRDLQARPHEKNLEKARILISMLKDIHEKQDDFGAPIELGEEFLTLPEEEKKLLRARQILPWSSNTIKTIEIASELSKKSDLFQTSSRPKRIYPQKNLLSPSEVNTIRKKTEIQINLFKKKLMDIHYDYLAHLIINQGDVYQRYKNTFLKLQRNYTLQKFKTMKTRILSDEEIMRKIPINNSIRLMEKFYDFNPFIFFSRLLIVPKRTAESDSFILGDADGSAARIMLIAIQSGHMELEEEGLELLARICYEEFKHCGVPLDFVESFQPKVHFHESYPEENDRFVSFQNNTMISHSLHRILDTAIFTSCHFNLICLGDILHDRLSCDKRATIRLIRNLHRHGAIFIKGNHDSLDQTYYNKKLNHFIGGTLQYGSQSIQHGFSGKTLEEAKAKWTQFEEECFLNCFYDEEKKIFYIHNGLDIFHDKYQNKNFLLTQFHPHPQLPSHHSEKFPMGNFLYTVHENERVPTSKFYSPTQLMTFLNDRIVNQRASLPRYAGVTTNFRPTDDAMKNALDTLFPGQSILGVHGHDGEYTDPREVEDSAIFWDKRGSRIFNVNSYAPIDYDGVPETELRVPVAICL